MSQDWVGIDDIESFSEDNNEYWFGPTEISLIKATTGFEGGENFAALDSYCYVRDQQECEGDIFYPASTYVGAEISLLLDDQTNDGEVGVCDCDTISDDAGAFNCMLQAQSISRPTITYASKGPSHDPRFSACANYRGVSFLTREFKTKKEVEKHVIHVIMHHLPSQDIHSNVYRFVEKVFLETVDERSDSVSWHVSSAMTLMSVERFGKFFSFFYPDGELSRGHYECMHSYNKFFSAYSCFSCLPRDLTSLASHLSVKVQGNASIISLSSDDGDVVEEIIESDPPPVKLLKVVRVLCGDRRFEGAFKHVVLSPIKTRDLRSRGDLFLGGVNIRSLMSFPSHAPRVERKQIDDAITLRHELDKYEDVCSMDKLLDLKGISKHSEVSRKVPLKQQFPEIKRQYASVDHRVNFQPKRERSIPYSKIQKLAAKASRDEVDSAELNLAKKAVMAKDKPPHVVSYQGLKYQLDSKFTSENPSRMFQKAFTDRVKNFFVTDMAFRVGRLICDIMLGSPGPVTSQEIVRKIHASPGPVIPKAQIHQLLQKGCGNLWTYVMRDKDKYWTLKIEVGSPFVQCDSD